MEIVSYVGFNNSSQSDFLSELKDSVKTFTEKRFENFHKPQRQLNEHSSKARSISLNLNAHDILLRLGQVFDTIALYAKRLLVILILLSALCAIVLSFGITKTYFQNKTGTIKLNYSEDTEFAMLNKAMSKFALDEGSEYNADGTIPGEKALSQVDMEKLFRQPVKFQTYKVQSGDTISGITKKFGLKNLSTLIAVNDIGNVRALSAGQKLKIPSMDGLFYTVQKGNSLAGLSSKFGITIEDLVDVNELESAELSVGQRIFIPGAKLEASQLQQAMGTMFKTPISAKYRLTSYFGPRADPFTGARSNHTGIDMACPTGTPISATASGTVVYCGQSPIFGNYVIIKHNNGYQSLYGHMSKIIAKKGQWVSQGTRIGLVGSTGYSTGPHLHFTVYKNGKLVDPLQLIK